MNIGLMALILFLIAVLMTMTGRGGGNFYVITLVLFGVEMHTAATTGQFILFISSLAATLIYGQKRVVEWKLVFFIGILTAVSSFCGGYFSAYFSGKTLKFVFSFFLLIAALLMLRPVKELEKKNKANKRLVWRLKSGDNNFIIDLKTAVPIIIATGFGAGMVGVSGGSFLVPLMVLACSVPMRIAVGTSTTLVSITALMGFIGHTISGHFDYRMAVPLALAGAIGGILGGKIAMKTKSTKLKLLFAYTTLAASIIMVLNAIMSK